ncbi:hypothetical protein BDR03DRAFT_976008 [Suillus americanus]|nr:hypothetical protein BDR03DRAFT_976008 [Suillus americanus]
MTMTVGFLSLPTELICHILALLNPKDINRCAMTCNTFRIVVRNSAGIQYKLEIYAQGLISTETATMHSNGISGKTCSLKKLAYLTSKRTLSLKQWLLLPAIIHHTNL